MSLSTALYSKLSGYSGGYLSEMVDGRIQPVQGHVTTALPYVSYSIISEQIYEESEASSPGKEAIVQIDLYGMDYDELDILADMVHDALVGKHATWGELTEVTVFRSDKRTSNEFAMQGQNQAPYQILLQYSIQYHEG